MRIIAGKHRGRKLAAVTVEPVRPTPDRVREAVMSIIGPRIPGSRVLDLYAGTGAMGLEALSRGAESAVFVDASPKSAALVRKNLAILKEEARARVVVADAEKGPGFLAKGEEGFDLVFADPPYKKTDLSALFQALDSSGAPAPGALVVLEHEAPEIETGSAPFTLTDTRKYGRTRITFFEYEPSQAPES